MDAILRSGWGVSGYAYWKMPDLVYWVTPILMLVAILSEGSGNVLNLGKRIGLGLVFLVVFLGTITIFYLIYNPPNSILIPGVQGRYFIIGIPLLIFAFLPQEAWLNQTKAGLLAGSILIALIGVSGLFLVYHIPCGSSFYSTGLCYLPQYKNWSPQTSIPIKIVESTHLSQTFISNCENLNQIKIWVGHEGTPTTGGLSVRLSQVGSQETTASKVIPQAGIPASGWLMVDFPPVLDSKAKLYVIDVEPVDKTGQQDIKIAYSKTNEYLNGELNIEGEKQVGDLLFQYGCRVGLESLLNPVKP